MGLFWMLATIAAFSHWRWEFKAQEPIPANLMLYGSLLGSLRFAPYFGMIGGGLFAVRHYVLRVSLWLGGFAPLKYVHFPNSAADRLLLRKVGDGYIFTHRMLMDYFSKLSKGLLSQTLSS